MVFFLQGDAPVNREKTVCFIDKRSLNIVDFKHCRFQLGGFKIFASYDGRSSKLHLV